MGGPLRRSWMLAGLLLTAVLVPGCAVPEPDGAEDGNYQVSGTFTEEATQEEMQALGNHTRAQGGEIAYLESFPVQFRASNLTEPACEDVRAFAADQTYVAEVGACETPTRG